jgi:hypothetical protein
VSPKAVAFTVELAHDGIALLVNRRQRMKDRLAAYLPILGPLAREAARKQGDEKGGAARASNTTPEMPLRRAGKR